MLDYDYSYINWQGSRFNARRGLCKEIESTVPHLKHMKKYLLAYSWRFMPNQTPIWLYFIVFACFSCLVVGQTRERESENGHDAWCALFVITSIFKPARERKKDLRQVKKHFAKCNFQRSITIRREDEKRDYSRNFSKWHDSVNTFTT